MEEASYNEVTITCRKVKQRKESKEVQRKKKQVYPFRVKKRKERNFSPVRDWSGFHRWKRRIIWAVVIVFAQGVSASPDQLQLARKWSSTQHFAEQLLLNSSFQHRVESLDSMFDDLLQFSERPEPVESKPAIKATAIHRHPADPHTEAKRILQGTAASTIFKNQSSQTAGH
jgi:hypothetical protein